MAEMEDWTLVTYLEAGAYIAIMLAVLGVPQMLSSYFDLRARRQQEERQEERHRQEEERRRQDDERRHQELMAILATVLSNGRDPGNEQGETIRTLQQTIDELRAENERLRQQNGNSDPAC